MVFNVENLFAHLVRLNKPTKIVYTKFLFEHDTGFLKTLRNTFQDFLTGKIIHPSIPHECNQQDLNEDDKTSVDWLET